MRRVRCTKETAGPSDARRLGRPGLVPAAVLLVGIAGPATSAEAAPSVSDACRTDARAGVRLSHVRSISVSVSRVRIATVGGSSGLYSCSAPRRLLTRLDRGTSVPVASVSGSDAAWVERRRGRTWIARRTGAGDVGRRRLTGAVPVTAVAIVPSRVVVVLRRSDADGRVLLHRWTRDGRWRPALGSGAFRRPGDRLTLYKPDDTDVLIDGDAFARPHSGTSIDGTLVPHTGVPPRTSRCANPGGSRTRISTDRYDVQVSTSFIRSCDRRTGSRRYLVAYSPAAARSASASFDGAQSFALLTMLGTTVLTSHGRASSHYGEGGESFIATDLSDGRETTLGSRDYLEYDPTFQPEFATLDSLGTCAGGLRQLDAPETTTTAVAAGGYLLKRAYVDRSSFDSSRPEPPRAARYVDATGAHDIVPDAGTSITVRASSFTFTANGAPITLTPRSLGRPANRSDLPAC
jgi:hypothetical protein